MVKIKRFMVMGAFVSGMGFFGCATGPKNVQGEYQVTGSPGVSSASVTYTTAAGVSANAISVTLPWNYQFTGTETEGSYQGTNVFLAAQNNSSSGSVTAAILEDNKVFQQGSATWPQAAITISGSF